MISCQVYIPCDSPLCVIKCVNRKQNNNKKTSWELILSIFTYPILLIIGWDYISHPKIVG